MRKGVAQLIDRKRLEEIVVNAACDEVTIEADIIDSSGRDHDRPGLADFRERIDVVERIRGLGEIHEKNVRAGRDGQRLDGVPETALVDLLRRPAVLDGNRTKHVGRCIVADEGSEGIAQTGARLERSVHH